MMQSPFCKSHNPAKMAMKLDCHNIQIIASRVIVIPVAQVGSNLCFTITKCDCVAHPLGKNQFPWILSTVFRVAHVLGILLSKWLSHLCLSVSLHTTLKSHRDCTMWRRINIIFHFVSNGCLDGWIGWEWNELLVYWASPLWSHLGLHQILTRNWIFVDRGPRISWKVSCLTADNV